MKIISLLFLLVGILSFGMMTIISLNQHNVIEFLYPTVNKDLPAKVLIFIMAGMSLWMTYISYVIFRESK